MKRIFESWKPYFLILSVLLLVITVVSDQYRPLPESIEHDSGDSHKHDHAHDPDEALGSPKSLDKAFGQGIVVLYWLLRTVVIKCTDYFLKNNLM